MQILKLNEGNESAVLVHSYAMSGTNLKKHIAYVLYVLDNFNIVSIVMDYNGGQQFLSSLNRLRSRQFMFFPFGQHHPLLHSPQAPPLLFLTPRARPPPLGIRTWWGSSNSGNYNPQLGYPTGVVGNKMVINSTLIIQWRRGEEIGIGLMSQCLFLGQIWWLVHMSAHPRR